MKTRSCHFVGILAIAFLCFLATTVPAHAAGGTFALVQHVNNAACPSSTTCTITLSQSIAPGDLLIFESSAGNAVTTATDNAGTFVQCLSCVGFDGTTLSKETSGGWILSAAAESSTITVTFNAEAYGGAIEMWEYSYSGETPGFDGANQNENQSSSSPTAATFTPSGTNDISVQACRASTACNSVSSPFLGDNLGNDFAWAYLSSPTSWTAPTWTLSSSGVSQLTQMEFGFGVSPCANTMFMDFAGTDGTPISLTQVASGTYGWQGGQWTIGGSGATFATTASQPLPNATGRLCDGSNVADPSTTGLQFSTAGQQAYLQINSVGGILSAGTSVSAGVWYYSNLPATDDSAVDDFGISGFDGEDAVALHEYGTGAERVGEIECGSGTSAGNIVLARNTWYWVDIVYNISGNHTMKFYNNANPPVQIGSTLTCPSKGTVPPGDVGLGIQNPDVTLPSGYVFNYDSLLVSLDGIDPLLPTGPSPTPMFSPAPGVYSPSQAVTLSDANSNAVIYYTTNGTKPSTSSSVYSGPIQVTATTTIQAIAAVSGYNNSYVASGTYTILPQAPTPTFSPAPGTYSSPQSVALSDSNSSATIYYTTNGMTPTTSSSVYTAPIPVNATTTIEAIAVAPNYGNSAVAAGTYTIATGTPITPYIQVNWGSWQQSSSVTVSAGSTVNLGPQPLNGGSWSWTGPHGYTSTSRQINNIPLNSGVNTYVATYTNPAGSKSTETFTITVTGWEEIGNNIDSIACSSDGTLVVANDKNQSVWEYSPVTATWTQLPGQMRHVAIVNKNSIWGIGLNGNVFYLSGSNWVQVGVNASYIAAGSDGTVLVTNSWNGSIWKYVSPNNWVNVPGGYASVIAVVQNNDYFAINNGNVYQYNGSSWTQVANNAAYVRAASDGTVLETTSRGQIYQYVSPYNWVQVPGSMLIAAPVKANVFFGLGLDYNVYSYGSH